MTITRIGYTPAFAQDTIKARLTVQKAPSVIKSIATTGYTKEQKEKQLKQVWTEVAQANKILGITYGTVSSSSSQALNKQLQTKIKETSTEKDTLAKSLKIEKEKSTFLNRLLQEETKRYADLRDSMRQDIKALDTVQTMPTSSGFNFKDLMPLGLMLAFALILKK